MSLPNYATNLALINKADGNKVTNISWGFLYDTSWLAENEDIIASNDLHIEIGDIYNYETNKFYRNGVEVQTINDMYNDQTECLNIITQGVSE